MIEFLIIIAGCGGAILAFVFFNRLKGIKEQLDDLTDRFGGDK